MWRARQGALVNLCRCCGVLDSIRELLPQLRHRDTRAVAEAQLEEVESFLRSSLERELLDAVPPGGAATSNS